MREDVNVSIFRRAGEGVIYEFAEGKPSENEESLLESIPAAVGDVPEDCLLYGIRLYQHNDEVERVYVGDGEEGIVVSFVGTADEELFETLLELDPPIKTVRIIYDA